MKKKSLAFTCLLILLSAQNVFANSGSAVIPYFRSFYISGTNYWTSRFYISNITASDITVKVSYYDKNGTLVQDGDDSTSNGALREGLGTVTSWDDNPTNASVSFTLGGNDTCEVYFGPSTPASGYALIEWSQSTNATVGLVAVMEHEQYNSNYELTLVNNGLPF